MSADNTELPSLRDLYIRWYLAQAKLESDCLLGNWTVQKYRAASIYVTKHYRDRAAPYIQARAREEYEFTKKSTSD